MRRRSQQVRKYLLRRLGSRKSSTVTRRFVLVLVLVVVLGSGHVGVVREVRIAPRMRGVGNAGG